MGVSDDRRFAVVTNIRDAGGPSADKQSRGELVSNWLANGMLPCASEQFNPYNLVVANQLVLQFVSNRPAPTKYPLPTGIHGLSNAIPDENWPRKDRLVAQMADWFAGPADRPEALLDLLGAEEQHDHYGHPIFIRSPIYGTRCSTVVAVDDAGGGRIIERRYGADGIGAGETWIDFNWT